MICEIKMDPIQEKKKEIEEISLIGDKSKDYFI